MVGGSQEQKLNTVTQKEVRSQEKISNEFYKFSSVFRGRGGGGWAVMVLEILIKAIKGLKKFR